MTLLICNRCQINLDNTYQIILICSRFVVVSLFAPLHECSHSTAFKSKFLNQAVMFFCGMVHLMPSIWFENFIWSITDTLRILQWILNLGMNVRGR